MHTSDQPCWLAEACKILLLLLHFFDATHTSVNAAPTAHEPQQICLRTGQQTNLQTQAHPDVAFANQSSRVPAVAHGHASATPPEHVSSLDTWLSLYALMSGACNFLLDLRPVCLQLLREKPW